MTACFSSFLLSFFFSFWFLFHSSPYNRDFSGLRNFHTTNIDNKGDAKNKEAKHIMNTFIEGVDVL